MISPIDAVLVPSVHNRCSLCGQEGAGDDGWGRRRWQDRIAICNGRLAGKAYVDLKLVLLLEQVVIIWEKLCFVVSIVALN